MWGSPVGGSQQHRRARGATIYLASFEAIVRALNDSGVRYLIAGGLAVVAHGYVRLTADVDLVVELRPDSARSVFRALGELGYRPSVPVTAEEFANAAQRRRWIDEKGMRVLDFHSERHPLTSVDVFVQEPFDFDAEYDRALVAEIVSGLPVRFVSLDTLIAMKSAAGRPVDLEDVRHLRLIEADGERDG